MNGDGTGGESIYGPRFDDEFDHGAPQWPLSRCGNNDKIGGVHVSVGRSCVLPTSVKQHAQEHFCPLASSSWCATHS